MHGILGVHVDDGVCGGDEWFKHQIARLQEKLPFGSQKSKEFTFTGIFLQQFPDWSIRAQQTSYIRNIPAINVPRPRRVSPESPLTETEKSSLTGIVGSLQYAVTHTRPDLASRLAGIQMQMSSPTIQTLLDVNKGLREGQDFEDVGITFQSIPSHEVSFISTLYSHQGVVIGATDQKLQLSEP